ncbi:hypothetical protein K458DRAFT_341090 [Lentithecium fluviatile CBS 122367]|uniref:DUF300-domain-containing protein n=1 Tax=Lentithecium fluviatile CBS 122367 TaxID=1168545 RepID=A0A6G1IY23_9PLEO|nr:hypothetical protein K458DRAFT_341090 [Lentithecium fluviatile CBS 122367]
MSAAHLVLRKLFHDNDNKNSSKAVCPTENTQGPDIVPFVGNLTFHSFASILSGACAAASLLIALTIIALHAINYSNPIQQRQVIRIILLVPWVAIFAFLTVWQSGAGEYLVESLDFGCAIAISAFLLLLCDFVLSNKGSSDELFGEGASRRGQFRGESPVWLKRTWYLVLQFIPVSIIVWAATCITVATGIYCGASNSPHFAHIWISVIKMVSTIAAVLAVLKFYKRMKAHLAPHNVFLKFFAFKGIIGLNVLQTFIINILVGNGTIAPSKYLTYHDIKTGLPSLILACEMPIFAALLFVAFPVSVYKGEQRGPAAGPLVALVQTFDMRDLGSAFVRGPMRLLREQQWGMERQSSFPLAAEEGLPPAGYGREGLVRV